MLIAAGRLLFAEDTADKGCLLLLTMLLALKAFFDTMLSTRQVCFLNKI